ncbi:protein FAM187B [Mixophyes fleayi]|uniref:protein FAM187B n=1 Tax=Mixophyes fleayi TaxID=3061075 RepID=UPI003F4DA87E
MNEVPRAIFLVVIFLEMTSARNEKDITLSCPAHRPCTTALASYNPIPLKCEEKSENALISWQYLDVFQPHAQAVTFMQSNGSAPHNNWGASKALDLMSRSKLVSGDLQILSPRVQDTGVYTCLDGEKYLAYYEIDFQDAGHIYISHASLGQSVQPQTMVDLGEEGTVKVFTVWTDWQPCDRCRTLGERKKVGFCYAEVIKDSTQPDLVYEGPTPCGLLRSTSRQIPLNHTPELRIEMCNEPCNTTASVGERILSVVLDSYHTYLHADVSLKCPTSSIYRPVYWEHGNKSFTRLQQLTKTMSYVLDNTTGGGSLYIPILNKSDAGIYKCYVDRVLTGIFHVIIPDTQNTAVRQPYTATESVIIAISMLLFSLMLLSIIQVCRKISMRVVH